MNKIYKVIFNRNKNRYEIVSELASSRGGKCKVKAGKQIGKLFMTGLLATSLSSVASAAEKDAKIVYDPDTKTIKILDSTNTSTVLASYVIDGQITSSNNPGNHNIILGSNASANPNYAVSDIIALGTNSTATQSSSIAIGQDAHAGNVNGTDNSNGKIAIGTKTVASGDRSIALGNKSNTNKGSYNIVQGDDSIGIGTSTSVFGYSSVSIGRRNIIGIPDPNLVSKSGVLTTKSRTKYSEDDLGGNSVIVGAYNVAYGNRSNVIGTYSRAMGSNSVAIGSGVQSLSDGAIAIGKGSGYEFADGSRFKNNRKDTKDDYYGRDWELPPEYQVLKQVLSNDIEGDSQYKKPSSDSRNQYKYKNDGLLPKYNNYGAGSSDPGGFIVEGKNALGIGTYTQVRGDSAIGLATGKMTADLSDKDKSDYARDMSKIMDMEETLYNAKEALKSGSTSDKATLEDNVKTAEESLATAKKEFRKKYLSEYSFVEGNGALGVGRQILAQGDRSMAVGDYAKAISSDAIAYGGQTLANGTNSMAMGGKARVGTETNDFDNSMAIGSHTNVQAGNAVALGAFSQVTGQNSLALGFGKQSGGAITYNSVSGKDSTLIGSYGNIIGDNSILIGSSGSIANDRVVALGNNIHIAAANSDDQENNTAGSVFLGDHAGYVTDSKRARSLGKVDVVGSNEKMELTESLSSTKGALRDYTKDFIYIYMLEKQDDGTQIGAPIAVRSDFAGGDSTVGVVSVGSTYEQTFENLDKIKEHHKKVGSLITVPVEVTVQVMKNGISLGKQQQTRYFAADATQEQINSDSTLSDEDKKKVWDTIQESRKKADTKYTVFETRRIQNVAPGLIGSNSTDAINGSQLFATNQMLGNLVGSLKKALGDNVTITPDGQINTKNEDNTSFTLGWIAKADSVEGSNGTVSYEVDKAEGETEEAYQARIAKLKKDGYIVDAAKVMTFKAGKNIGLVQKPGELSISTIDTPSFTSVELRGETKDVDGKNVTEVTKIDSSGMKVVTETSTPASDGSTTPPTVKVSTTVGKDGVSTDGSVKVTNGKTGDDAKDLVTIGKNVDPDAPAGTDGENGTIGLDGKNGSSATITVDRGTSSLDDKKNIGGTYPKQDISKDNPAKMDRITYTTKNKDGKDVITHEVATMDDGLFFSGDSADGVESNGVDANTFGRKLSQETKIVGGVALGLQADATAEQRKAAIADKLTDGNIGVISDGTDTLTVKLAKQLTGLDSTTYTSPTTKTDDGDDATSTMKVDGNGVRFVENNGDTVNNTPTFTTDGITGGNKTITDVASGIGGKVKDPDKNNANTFLENVNKIGKKDGDQPAADAISENVVVNAKDLKNLVDTGFKLNTSGQGTAGASTVKIGDTINVINGVNTKVSAIIDDTVNGTHTFHIDVTGMPISYTDNQGNALTKIGDKYYKNTDIENGKPKTNATEVPADEVTNNIKVINKDGTTNNQGTISNVKSVFDSNIGNGADTGSKVDEIKDGSVISNTGSNQFINDLTKLNDQVDPKATDAEAEKIRAKKDEEKLNSVSTVRDLQKVALTPLFFEGDVAQDAQTANTFGRKLSEKTKIVGGQKDVTQLTDGNIGVVSNGTDTLTIKLAKELQNLTSVTTGSGDNTTVMNQDGVTITTQTPKNGDKPASTTETKLSKDGLATDGTVKVTNGKTGDDAKDLVTIAKGTETDQNATDKEFGTVAIDGKNGSNAILTVDRGTKSVTDSANVGKDSSKPVSDDNQAGMDRLTYTTTGADGKSIINHEVATLDDGFFLTTEHTEENKTRTVLFNNTIKVLDGANTKVSAMGGEDGTHTFSIDVTGLPMTYTATDANGKTQDVHKVGDTYTLADGTKLVQVGDKFYKPDQVQEVNGTPQVKADQEDKDTKLNNISLTSPVANTAPTLSNVGSALKKSGGTRITMSDLDDGNAYPTDHPIWNNAVNVGDLKAATDAARTEVTGTGEAFVTRKQATDGHTIYNVHVDKILSHKDAAGNELVRGGDGKYYTNKEIKDKTYIPSENKWYSNRDITDGKPNKDAQAVTPTPVDQSNVKTSLVNPNTGVGTGTDTSMTLDNVKSGIGGDAGNGIKDGTTVDGTQGNNTFIKNLDKVGGTGKGAIDKTTVVNAGDLKNLADTPLFFSGDVADSKDGNVKNTFGRKLSEEAKIVGGVTTPANLTDNNIGVVSNGSDTLTIKLAKQLTGLDSATYTSPTTKTDDGDATSTMKVDGNGIRFVGDNNAVKTDAPSLTTDGITGGNKQITNVGSGLKDGDTTISISDLDDSEKWPNTSPIWNNAVNVGDLKKAKDAATTEVTGTGKAIVTKTVGNKGQNIYNVHVDPVVDVVATDGKTPVVRGDDGKYYKPSDIANKTYIPNADGNGGNWYDNGDLTNGVPNQGAKPQNVTPTDVKNNFVNPNGTGSIVLDNVKSGIGGEVKDAAGKNTFIDNINKVVKKSDDDTAAPDAISENTVVNAKDLKNVVDTGFKLNTSGHSGDAQTVKIGDTIQVVDGKNTTVSAITHPTTGVHEFHIDITGLPVTYTAKEGENGQPVDVSKVGDTYQLADGTKLVKYGDKFYKPNQIVNGQPVGDAQGFTINDDIRLVNPNNGTGPVKITNVAPGEADTDAVNMSQLKQQAAAATTEVTGTGAAEVTKKTAKDGHDIYNVHVDKLLTVKPVTTGTAMERGADGKYYAPSEIQDKTFVSDGNGGGSWYAKDDVDEYGTPLDGKSPLAQQPTALDPNTLKTSVTNPNGNGPTIVDNVKSVLDGSGIGNGADMSSKIDTIENGKPVETAGSNQFIKDLTGLNPTTDADKLNSVSTVSDLQKVALTPLFFEGDTVEKATTNNTFGRKLSEKAKIVGGQKDVTKLTDNNIGVVSNGSDTLTIKLAKELQDLTSLTTIDETDGTKTIVSGKGVTSDGKVVVNNGKNGDKAKELVTIDKGTDGSGTDKEYGKIGLDGKNGSEAVITIDRGTKSITDEANLGKDPSQPVSGTNKSANMDRITYTTKGANGDINHEVATLDDGFMLTTSTDVANSKAPANVKLNNTIKFTDGANTKVSTVTSKDGVHELHVDVTGLPVTYTVSQTSGTDAPVSVSKVGDTYQLADGTKLVKVGDKFYKPSQLVDPNADQPQVRPEEVAKDWTVNDSISLVNKDGSNNAPTTLKNVGSGLKDANGNATTLDKAVGSNAVNVDDLRTLGKAATTEVTGTGVAEVTKVTGANGQNIYNVHVERFMQVAETDVEGNKVVKAADNYYYKEADIKDKTYIDGQWYNNTDIEDKTKIGDKWYSNTEITDGKANPGATELTVQDTTPNKAVGLQNNLVNPNDNTPTRLSNLASALSGEVGNGANTEDNSAINGIDKNGKPTSESGNNTFVKNVLDLDATVKTEEQLKTSLGYDPSEDEVKAEKARAEKDKALLNSAVTVADLQKTLQSPLFFEGDSADGVANENGSDKNTFARKLSQKTKIVGGVDLGLKENATADERQKAIADKLTDGNIGVISDGTNTLTIKLAKNLVNLTSVETGSGDNKTKMTENGITTTVKDGNTFKVTTTTPNGLATTEVKLDSEGMPKGESTTTMVTTDGVTITTQTPPDPDGDKPASTTETKLSKDGLATDGTVKVTNGKTGDDAKDLVTIGKGTETDPNATDKEFGTVAIDGKNGSNAILTVDRGTKSVTDKANILKDPKQPAGDNNPVSMDRLTYTTTGPNNETINHEVATLDDGFFLTTEHTKADKTRTVLFNNTIKVLDGANTKVSAMGGEKGTHTFSIDVTGLPVTYTATKTDANGAPTGEPVDVSKVGDGYQLADGTKLVKVDDKYYKPEQLENNKPKPGEEGLTIKQSVSLVQDNGAPATLERVGSGRRNGMNAKDIPMDWNSILNAAADNAEVNNMLTNAANIGDVRDAIKSITNGTDSNAIGGFGLTGNNGEVKQDLGKTITIKGGIETKHDAATNKDVPAKSTTDKNTYVNVKNNEMVVEIAKDLIDLDSVTVGNVDENGNGGTVINKDGMTVKDATGNNSTSIGTGTIGTSKTDGNGKTSSTNIDGSTITLENKDKDGKTVGSKTDIGTDGIRITYKDDKGKTDPKKDVSLTDKGLNNGGNQIKNVGSGLVDKDGKDITDISNITNSDILSNGVNVGDLQKAINSVTNSSNGGGFGLTGNNGQIMQDLGKTITIKGGIANKKDDSGKDLPAKSTTAQNTYVNVKNNEMVVEIAKDLTDLDSVTIGNVDEKGNGGTVINKDSMTVKDKDGKNSTNIGTGTIGTSKTDGNGNTSSTNIDGSTITLENKDKDGKLTGPKTEVSNKGITITPVDEDGKPIEGKKVELSDKGLDNGGNQIKHVDSGLKKENGDSVKLEDAADDMLNNAVNVGDLKSVNEKLKDDIINISNQVDDIKNSAPVVYLDKDGNRVYKNGHDFFYKDGKQVKEKDKKDIRLSLVNADGKTTTPSTLQNVAKGVKDTDAVNVKQLTDATEKPLTFNGDAGSSSAKLGETVAIKGGANSADLTDNNIGVIANSSTKTLNVKLSKKLKGLESAEFVDNNGNTTNITGDGVHISGGNGSNVSLTSQGLNNGGNRITNVAPGVEATDAVNVSQLNQVGAALHNRINNVAKGAYGGVASAGAMASLPQAYLPGKSMVAAGASHYRGESAVALGASRISDNGKIILKLNASHNTSGNTMVGAGVGYQF
ncbi:YadA-like family protein [Gallibacterium anatis]|uniref:YadA-like family protein n=1 Tax=Gallibacterium anatis TaxID=750 RepID=UPI0039FC6A06